MIGPSGLFVVVLLVALVLLLLAVFVGPEPKPKEHEHEWGPPLERERLGGEWYELVKCKKCGEEFWR